MKDVDIFAFLTVSAQKRKFTIYDEKWDDIGFVTVHFRVKECKGWLFGVWFRENENTKKRYFELFGQPENNIDKFKPSRSHFCYTSTRELDGVGKGIEYTADDAVNAVIGAIHYDRALAWYLDNTGTYPRHRCNARMALHKHQLRQIWGNFMGDVGIVELKTGVIRQTFSWDNREYPFKGVVLFFKYLFNRKEKPYWNKM